MPDTISQSPANLPGKATARATTWGEIVVCGLILGLALYVALFAAILADALFFDRNLIIKPIENTSQTLLEFLAVIYYPEIVLLKFFRIVPG